jgi:hypothetical protein
MTSWIVGIRKAHPTHLEIAEAEMLWDLEKHTQVSLGDRVYFWLSGTGLVAKAVATGDIRPLESTESRPWEDSDSGTYQWRFSLRMLSKAPSAQPTWGEIETATGIRSKTNFGPRQVSDVVAEQWLAGCFSEATQPGTVDLRFDDDVPVSLEEMLVDNRERALRAIALRRGQGSFRSDLLTAYNRRCAVTGNAVVDVLEAAHISPHRGIQTDVVPNGLLLRADIHTLFDLHLLTITKDLQVRVSPELGASPYKDLHGKRLASLPERADQRPAAELLEGHHQECTWYAEEDPVLI